MLPKFPLFPCSRRRSRREIIIAIVVGMMVMSLESLWQWWCMRNGWRWNAWMAGRQDTVSCCRICHVAARPLRISVLITGMTLTTDYYCNYEYLFFMEWSITELNGNWKIILLSFIIMKGALHIQHTSKYITKYGLYNKRFSEKVLRIFVQNAL